MSFLDHLLEKSWTAHRTVADRHDERAVALPNVTIGLRVFLAVATVVFSLLVVAYAERMSYSDWERLPTPQLLWLNTALLALSSVGLHRAQRSARRGRMDGVKIGLLVGGGFTFAFLIGQLLAWQQLAASGYFAASNPANAFFYVLTAVHAVHLIGGLVAWGRTSAKAWRGVAAVDVRLSAELCAVYWHFLLAVWLVLFGLLLFT